jgi:signal peptidase I
MQRFNLNIADYILRFESATGSLELVPSERFLRNICSDDRNDILIRVHSGIYKLPGESKRVFDAPYIEEINGIRIRKSDEFWSINKCNSDLFICCIHPLSESNKKSILKFSLKTTEWDMWIEGTETFTNPLEYPLDGLVLYYMTVIRGDIMIHASGVTIAGRGYLFSGVSGKGKTTMARLWEEAGAAVIHDDRLIVRKRGDLYKIYNTPVYANDNPASAQLTRIFIIEHGKKNEIIPMSGAESVSLVMANCIQHNYDGSMVARLLEAVSQLCAAIPATRVLFTPDRSIVDEIVNYEKGEDNTHLYKEIGFTLLAEGSTIRVRADGYSMYPAIKPGSRIFIEPLKEGNLPLPGEIIAWKRERGLVVHRLVEIDKKGNDITFITRGDSSLYADRPVRFSDIAGRVTAVEDKNGKISRGGSLKRNHCYFYNRSVVWVLLKIKRISKLFREREERNTFRKE